MVEEDGQDHGLMPEEVAANKILARHALTPPFDIHTLTSRYADIENDDFDIPGDALLIERLGDHKRPLIILNLRRANPIRRRFTLSHELGHTFITWHHGRYSCSPAVTGYELPGEYGFMEAEANRFAAQLLLPTAWVKEFITRSASLGELIEGIVSTAEVSFDTARIKLIKCLPPGYVCVTEALDNSQLKVEHSSGTPVNLLFDYSD